MNKNINEKTTIDSKILNALKGMDEDQLNSLKGFIADQVGMAQKKAEHLIEDMKGLDAETISKMRDAMNWREIEAEEAKQREAAEEELRAIQSRNNDRLAAFICGGAAVIGSIIGAGMLGKGVKKLFK